MTQGISGDMFSAACYAFMGEELKEIFLTRIGMSCEELGGKIKLRELSCDTEKGYAIEYGFPGKTGRVSARRAGEDLCDIAHTLCLSASGERLMKAIFLDIVRAESKAHGVSMDSVHLHEIGRPAGLFNMATAGLCHDLLALGDREIIGSCISVGKGRVLTNHGWLRVPAPASATLLAMLKSRLGPYYGEMATPTGIAIARNLINKQVDRLPIPGRQGLGFGSKSFEGAMGHIRLFEKDESIKE